jgi:hypothetical protein
MRARSPEIGAGAHRALPEFQELVRDPLAARVIETAGAEPAARFERDEAVSRTLGVTFWASKRARGSTPTVLFVRSETGLGAEKAVAG